MSGEVKVYRITGYMLMGRGKIQSWQKFTVEVTALNERDALEKLYSTLGSKHKLKRHHIKINEIKNITREEITKPTVHRLLKLERIALK